MSARNRASLARAAVLLCALSFPTGAKAQDFADAGVAGPAATPAALLERALPAGGPAPGAESMLTRWWGGNVLETRALALGGGAGAVRVALGMSATGDPEVGWNALALGMGAVSADGGAALRLCARRDRAAGPLGRDGLTQGAGYEAGGGAWLALPPTLRVWASAPQLWREGAAPPLARPLELGVSARWDGFSAWSALCAPARADDGERLAGVALTHGTFAAWLEARDAPLRGAFGIRVTLRALELGVRVDEHPVLGETTHIALTWGAAPTEPDGEP